MVDAIGSRTGLYPAERPAPASDRLPAEAAPQTQAEAGGLTGSATRRFISPVIKLDREAFAAVLVFRDSESGDVERQYPSEQQLKAYAQAAVPVEEPTAPVTAGGPAMADAGGADLGTGSGLAMEAGRDAVTASVVSARTAAPAADGVSVAAARPLPLAISA